MTTLPLLSDLAARCLRVRENTMRVDLDTEFRDVHSLYGHITVEAPQFLADLSLEVTSRMIEDLATKMMFAEVLHADRLEWINWKITRAGSRLFLVEPGEIGLNPEWPR